MDLKLQERVTAQKLAEKYAAEKCKNLLISTGYEDDSNEDDDEYMQQQKKKDPSEMDEDELLLASEAGRNLTSKQRRQLRNRISARQFRLRRKEYITHLEGLVGGMTSEIDKLKSTIGQLKEQNTNMAEDLNKIKKIEAQISQCSQCIGCTNCRSARENQSQVLATQYQHIPLPTDLKKRKTKRQSSNSISSQGTSNSTTAVSGSLTATANSSSPEPNSLHMPVILPEDHSSLPDIASTEAGSGPPISGIAADGFDLSPAPGHQHPQNSQTHHDQVQRGLNMWQSTSAEQQVPQLNPSVASLLPSYPWSSEPVSTAPVLMPMGHESAGDWPLDYGDNLNASRDIPTTTASSQGEYGRLHYAQIYNSFIPEVEKMLDEQFTNDEEELRKRQSGGSQSGDEDEKRLKLALAAAEDMFKKLDIQLAGMSLDSHV